MYCLKVKKGKKRYVKDTLTTSYCNVVPKKLPEKYFNS